MSDTIVWTDGSKLRGKRLIDAYNRGVLVERRPTPGGVCRWIARCEHNGCQLTYDFTEISSRRVAEARCSQHVSRKGVKGGRAFFGEIEVIGERMRKALFDGRIVAADRRGPRSIRWTIKCSSDGCKNMLILSSSDKSSSRHQLCGSCNARRMKEEARSFPRADGKRNTRFVWTDGSWIVGQRIQQAFLDGKLVRKEGTHWFVRCEQEGCGELYDFSATTQLQCQQGLCWQHVKKKLPPLKRRRKILVAGRWTTNHDLAPFAASVIWKKVGKGRVRPHLKCENEKCENLAPVQRQRKTGLCQKCGLRSRALRPYEAVFRLFQRNQLNRNKKRKTPLKVEMSYQQFADFCEKNPDCFFCGRYIGRLPYSEKFTKDSGRKSNIRSAFLDRVDPTGHYTIENIVSACGPCNMSKNIFVSHNEMMLLGLLRSGKFEQAEMHLAKNQEAFSDWGRQVADHTSYWAGARKKR